MPEATIHEYCNTRTSEYQISLSRQRRDWASINSVAETSAMNLLTKTHFRSGVSPKHRLHATTHTFRARLR